MIDPALLKTLGWSEDLIAEVSRSAADIDKTARAIRPVAAMPVYRRVVSSGSVLYRQDSDSKTDAQLRVKTSDKGLQHNRPRT